MGRWAENWAPIRLVYIVPGVCNRRRRGDVSSAHMEKEEEEEGVEQAENGPPLSLRLPTARISYCRAYTTRDHTSKSCCLRRRRRQRRTASAPALQPAPLPLFLSLSLSPLWRGGGRIGLWNSIEGGV